MVRPSGVFAFVVSRFWSRVYGLAFQASRGLASGADCELRVARLHAGAVRRLPRLDGSSPVSFALLILAERPPARVQVVAFWSSVPSSNRMLGWRFVNVCLPATWRKRAAVGLRAERRPDTATTPAFARRLISRRMRSDGLFVGMCRQGSSDQARAGGQVPCTALPT